MRYWKWYKKDLEKVRKNGLKVFSTFSCGGGSSYGYKLAGYDVIGNCEIDPKINEMYIANQHPKYNFLMDLREFNKLENIPEELKEIDILDGSPPCSTFSMAGSRDKAWGVEKAFREGQKKQRLDDLFFVFLDTVAKLRPKVVVAENVEGLVQAKARGYVNEIIKRFRALGYDVQLLKLNSQFMGVPQARTRVFFIANRMNYPKLVLNFTERPIPFGEIREKEGKEVSSADERWLLSQVTNEDSKLADVNVRLRNKNTQFTAMLERDGKVCNTLASGSAHYKKCKGGWKECTDLDYVSMQTFPQDYDFMSNTAQYVCGMSVPPIMMGKIAEQINKQWFRK